MPRGFERRMMDFLKGIEQSGILSWVRESSSVWAYPTFIFMHSLGMAFLVGTSMVIDLRLLGFGRELPLEPMKKFFPVIWFGFAVNAASGFVDRKSTRLNSSHIP